MKINNFLLASLICLTPSLLFSGNSGYLGSFLRYGAGSREIAMGRSGTAISYDANSIFINPANLMNTRLKNISLNYVQMYENDYDSSLAFSIPFNDKLMLGVGSVFRVSGGYFVYDENNKRLRDASIYDSAFLAGLGRNFRYFNLGINLKYYYKKIYLHDSSAFSLDMGLSGRMPVSADNSISYGLFLQDIYPAGMRFINDTEYLQPTCRTGAGLWLFKDKLLISADLLTSKWKEYSYYTGAEINLHKQIRFRAGLNKNEITAGLGIKYRDIWLDYAYTTHDNLGISHRISVNFGLAKAEEKTADKIFKEEIKQVSESGEDVKYDIQPGRPEEKPQIEDIEKNYPVIIRTAESIPSAIYDLLAQKEFSVINVFIENKTEKPATFRVDYQIEGRTREETLMVRAKAKSQVNYYPSLMPEIISKLEVHTPATIIIKVYLVTAEGDVRWAAEKTVRATLNPYDQFCMKLTDALGLEIDLLDTIVSWITFNDRRLNEVLSKAADQGSMLIPPVKIIGDQPPYIFTRIIEDDRTLDEKDRDYFRQIKLIYNTLKDVYKVMYLNQPVVYRSCQRIKFPAMTLKGKGNCIELAVLTASLLESIEVEPVLALFIDAGHAAVGWRVSKDDEEIIHLLEMNVFGEEFDRLLEKGKELISAYNLEDEFKKGIPFPEDGIYRKNANTILLDVKKIRKRIPPSPYISQ